MDDNELFYAVHNRTLPVDVSSDRLPVTTKENPSFHGYGLQNVQTTLAKYHSVYATLDNAIEACEKLPVQDRKIYIQVVLDDNELFYAVRNRSLPVDVSSDRLPVTTKEDPSFHGYGLQNVQTTLAKYHSVYAMDYADGWFEFATDLPNTLIS